MATASWFFQPYVSVSSYVMQEHLRQDLWRSGPAATWVDVIQTQLPCKAVGYWHDGNFELEWIPRDYVVLRSNKYDEALVRAFSLQLGFKPYIEREEGDKSIVEWYLHPKTRQTAPMAAAGTE